MRIQYTPIEYYILLIFVSTYIEQSTKSYARCGQFHVFIYFFLKHHTYNFPGHIKPGRFSHWTSCSVGMLMTYASVCGRIKDIIICARKCREFVFLRIKHDFWNNSTPAPALVAINRIVLYRFRGQYFQKQFR